MHGLTFTCEAQRRRRSHSSTVSEFLDTRTSKVSNSVLVFPVGTVMKKRSREGQRGSLYTTYSTPLLKLPRCGLMHHEPRVGGKVYRPPLHSSSLPSTPRL
jgi:hypothetical protein